MDFQITFPEGFSYKPTKLPTQETIDKHMGVCGVVSVAHYLSMYQELQEILIARLVAGIEARKYQKRVCSTILASLIRLSTRNHEMIHLNDIIRLTTAYSWKSAEETIRRHRNAEGNVVLLERIYGL